MRVIVDESVCTATTTCVRLFPQMFALPEGTEAAVVTIDPLETPELVAIAKEAEMNCPTGAITVVDS